MPRPAPRLSLGYSTRIGSGSGKLCDGQLRECGCYRVHPCALARRKPVIICSLIRPGWAASPTPDTRRPAQKPKLRQQPFPNPRDPGLPGGSFLWRKRGNRLNLRYRVFFGTPSILRRRLTAGPPRRAALSVAGRCSLQSSGSGIALRCAGAALLAVYDNFPDAEDAAIRAWLHKSLDDEAEHHRLMLLG